MFDDEYRYQAHSEHAKQLSLMSCYCRVYGSSVANAIEYCNKKLNMENFKGSEATVTFIKTFDLYSIFLILKIN